MVHKGFTIAELTVVLLIMAVAAGAVTLRVHGPLSRASLNDAVGMISNFDALTRRYAREHDRPVSLFVDLASGQISRTDRNTGAQLGATFRLPGKLAIGKLLVGENQIAGASVAIMCSRRGLTPSYAILLEDKAGQARWILVAGLTGQITQFDNEQEIRQVLSALQKGYDAG